MLFFGNIVKNTDNYRELTDIALRIVPQLNVVKNLKVDGKKTLVLLPEVNKNVYLSARNLKGVEVLTASQLNSYKVLNADVLVISENSLKTIDGVLAK